MPTPSCLKNCGPMVHLNVRLQPRASKNEISGVMGDALKIKVTAPPVDSAANQALIKFLAGILDCPKSALHLVRGKTSRQKTIGIQNLSMDEIALRLKAWLS